VAYYQVYFSKLELNHLENEDKKAVTAIMNNNKLKPNVKELLLLINKHKDWKNNVNNTQVTIVNLYSEGYSQREIAKKLNMSVCTVYDKIFRVDRNSVMTILSKA
jgi:DNA-binding NarL/FixJ family response regulator